MFVFVGQNLKAKCEEKKEGQYFSHKIKTLESIETVDVCMKSCDQEQLCFGWLYDGNGQVCYLGSTVGKYVPTDGFVTGSCIGEFQSSHGTFL